MTGKDVDKSIKAYFFGAGKDIDEVIVDYLKSGVNAVNGVCFPQLVNFIVHEKLICSEGRLYNRLRSLEKFNMVFIKEFHGVKFYFYVKENKEL